MNKAVIVGFLSLSALWLLSRRAEASQAPSDSVGQAGSFDIVNSVENLIMSETRGERNNNPGNLRGGIPWLGLSANQSDADFAQFDDPIYGIRALALNLHNYQAKYGLTTIRQIVARWAPPTENNTDAYIASVSTDMGLSPDTPLNLSDSDTLQSLAAAIIHHENGRVIYDPSVIAQGVGLALA